MSIFKDWKEFRLRRQASYKKIRQHKNANTEQYYTNNESSNSNQDIIRLNELISIFINQRQFHHAEDSFDGKKSLINSRYALIISSVSTILTLCALGCSIYQSRIANRSLTLSERAFVSVVGIDATSGTLKGKSAQTWIASLENSGSSPTISYESWSNCRNYNSAFVFSREKDSKESRLSIGPKAKVGSIPCTMTDEDIKTSVIAGMHVYFFGEATYKDIFKEKHQTRWCSEITINPENAAYNVIYCRGTDSRYNCTDDECINHPA